MRILGIILAAVSTTAIAAPSNYPTCAQARVIVQQRGAAVIHTGPQTYDRYVSDRSYCGPTQVTQQAIVSTRDSRACPIGFTCVDPENDRDFFWDR